MEGGRRPIQGRGHGEAGPRHKLHQYRNNDPRGLEGLIYEFECTKNRAACQWNVCSNTREASQVRFQKELERSCLPNGMTCADLSFMVHFCQVLGFDFHT